MIAWGLIFLLGCAIFGVTAIIIRANHLARRRRRSPKHARTASKKDRSTPPARTPPPNTSGEALESAVQETASFTQSTKAETAPDPPDRESLGSIGERPGEDAPPAKTGDQPPAQTAAPENEEKPLSLETVKPEGTRSDTQRHPFATETPVAVTSGHREPKEEGGKTATNQEDGQEDPETEYHAEAGASLSDPDEDQLGTPSSEELTGENAISSDVDTLETESNGDGAARTSVSCIDRDIEQSEPFAHTEEKTRIDNSEITDSSEPQYPTEAATPVQPRKYAGISSNVPKDRKTKRRDKRESSDQPTGTIRSLPIEVRLLFSRDGFCDISLVPSRAEGMPDYVAATGVNGLVELGAMQDEWYQDFIPDCIEKALAEGVAWQAESAGAKWSLSGRELFVLSQRSDLSGWVSQPRLKIGTKHVVLCTERLREAVTEALNSAGAAPPAPIDSSLGAPAGWIAIRDVIPTRSVSPSTDADLLNALRPLPEIEIECAGGIRLERQKWLDGYPPTIRILGAWSEETGVVIDGALAASGEDGAFRAPGWDQIGDHTVWCEGKSKSYSIVPFEASWEAWPAYQFFKTDGASYTLNICGPLVYASSPESDSDIVPIEIPASHPVVLGAQPGDVVYGEFVSGVRSTIRMAFPPFRPVWALPSNPLLCNKKKTRILLIGHSDSPGRPQRGFSQRRAPEIKTWCRLILDANRKGLSTEPDNDSVHKLWSKYKSAARRIWRARR